MRGKILVSVILLVALSPVQAQENDQARVELGTEVTIMEGQTVTFDDGTDSQIEITEIGDDSIDYTDGSGEGHILDGIREGAYLDLSGGRYHLAVSEFNPEEGSLTGTFTEAENNEQPSSTDGNSIQLSDTTFNPGETVDISATAKQGLADRNYKILVKSPAGETLESTTHETVETSMSYDIPEEASVGEYNVIMKPVTGSGIFDRLGGLVNDLLGEPPASETFEVQLDVQAWKQWCHEQGYTESADVSITSSEGLRECIADSDNGGVVDVCFTADPPESCEEDAENVVAQSTCQNFHDLTYSPEEAECDCGPEYEKLEQGTATLNEIPQVCKPIPTNVNY